ncbi:MAG: hypothetical protein M3T56_02055 [Chloroflexota bacterium]|nr:hypothetical protein [Chloroflexota bacterium]
MWIATRIFGYTITEPAQMGGRTVFVAIVVVLAGMFILLGASPATPE